MSAICLDQAQKENMNRMHTEAEAELNLLQKAERLQVSILRNIVHASVLVFGCMFGLMPNISIEFHYRREVAWMGCCTRRLPLFTAFGTSVVVPDWCLDSCCSKRSPPCFVKDNAVASGCFNFAPALLDPGVLVQWRR